MFGKKVFVSYVAVAFLSLSLYLLHPSSAARMAASVTQDIKMDYFGYRPNDVKIAIFTPNPGATVQIRNTSDAVVFTIPTNGGSITSMGADGQPSGDTVWQVDFTVFFFAGGSRVFVSA